MIANLPAGMHYAFVSQFDGSASAAAQYTLEIDVFGGSIVRLFESLPRDLWRSPGHRQFAFVELKQIAQCGATSAAAAARQTRRHC
ncbi:MAG TPA: hypothetical protein VMO26_10600 [Vicinamibacterales bacterium]|nr:hypothetical protein [Vicinamibacterales bacterium]